MRDHRYPDEVKADYRRRVTLAKHPEIAALTKEFGRFAVLAAAEKLIIKDQREARA